MDLSGTVRCSYFNSEKQIRQNENVTEKHKYTTTSTTIIVAVVDGLIVGDIFHLEISVFVVYLTIFGCFRYVTLLYIK